MKDKIQQLLNENKHLYYNTEGSTTAYKLGLKHLSAAPMCNEAILIDGMIVPNEKIFLVDLELEEIIETEDRIKLIKLKTY